MSFKHKRFRGDAPITNLILPVTYTDRTITANETWTSTWPSPDGIVKVSGLLKINANATLTIQSGVKVAFSQTGWMEIAAKGKVILYGQLTNQDCSQHWKGVTINGASSTLSQYAVTGIFPQGRLEGKPGSVIENAFTGVACTNGGQVICFGTTFKNNRTSVDIDKYRNFWPYQTPAGQYNQLRDYAAAFSNCTFLADNNLPAFSDSFHSFIKLRGVVGVRIGAGSFKNNRSTPNALSISDYGYGIFAQSVSVRIGGSFFQGLGYGIHNSFGGVGATYADQSAFSVTGATFEKCYVHIFNSRMKGHDITFNDFKMGSVPNPALIKKDPNLTGITAQTGVMMRDETAGFNISQNRFLKTTDDIDRTVGVVCQELGAFSNVIYKNYFEDVEIGNMATGGNGGTVSLVPRGLTYQCNENATTRLYDFYTVQGSIRPTQGFRNDINLPVGIGNLFSFGDGVDFMAQSGTIYQYYDDEEVRERPLKHNLILVDCDLSGNCGPTFYCQNLECTAVQDYGDSKTAYDALVAQNNPAQNSAKMAQYQWVMDRSAAAMVQYLQRDTLHDNTAALRRWTGRLNTIGSEITLAWDDLSEGETPAALQRIEAARLKYGTAANQSAFTDLQSLFQFLADKKTDSLTIEQVATLETPDR